MSTDEYLTPEEFATEFRVSTSAVYRALREGRIVGVKVLRHWRIPRSSCPQPEAPPADDDVDPMPRPARRRPSDSLRSRAEDVERRRRE